MEFKICLYKLQEHTSQICQIVKTSIVVLNNIFLYFTQPHALVVCKQVVREAREKETKRKIKYVYTNSRNTPARFAK